jgi:methylenetetrahydrofolate reductase (NADPH)
MIPTAAALPTTSLPHADAAQAVHRIGDFLRGYSLEATRPKASDIEALKASTPAGTRIYLSAVAGKPVDEVVSHAKAVRAAGYDPAPHLAARKFASPVALSGLLAKLNGEANVRHVLVIAGDSDAAAGPFASSIEVIESGLLQRHGITGIGIAGHPDGHPRIPAETLQLSLSAKIEAAQQSGLTAEIVTQFCFDPQTIIRWVGRLRDHGIENPVRVGMAGPASVTTLMRYSARCGVKASAAGAARQAGLLKHLFGGSALDAIVRALAETGSNGRLGDIAAHFFSFGGVDTTARWAAAAGAGRIALDSQDGFAMAR